MLLIVFTVSADKEIKNLKNKIDYDRIYLESLINKYPVIHKKRILTCIQKHAYIYDHPIEMFGRLAEVESGFRYWAENTNTDCVGLYGISTYWWAHLPWKICNSKYAEYLNKNKGTNYKKVMKFIEANTEMGAIILKEYKEMYGGYSNALYVYGGWRKYEHKTNEAQNYISRILYGY